MLRAAPRRTCESSVPFGSSIPPGSTGRASSAGMSLRDEIADQPRVVRRLLDEGWPEARALGRARAGVEHITLVARGSSDNAATYGQYLLESIAGVVPARAAPCPVPRYGARRSSGRG